MTPEQINKIRAQDGLPPVSEVTGANEVDRASELQSAWGESETQQPKNLAEKIGFTNTKVGKTGQKIFDAFTSSTKKLGESAGESFAADENISKYDETLQSFRDIELNLQKVINEKKKLGKDTSKLEEVLFEHQTNEPKMEDFVGTETSRRMDETFGQNAKEIGKQAVGTALEANLIPEIKFGGLFAKKASTAGGKVLEKVGENLYDVGIPTSKKEAEMLQAYKADNSLLDRAKSWLKGTDLMKPRLTSQSAIESKTPIMGTKEDIGIQAKRASEKLWKGLVQPALQKTKGLLFKDEIFSPIEKRISETVEPAKRQAYMDAYEALKSEYKNINHMTLEDAQKVKVDLDKFTPDKVFNGKPIANEYKTLQNDMANAIREKTYNTLGDEVKQAYWDYGNLKGLQEMGVKAMTGEKLKGGAGSFVSEIISKAVTPITTIGGKTVYETGKGIQFVGESGAKTIGDIIKGKSFRLSK